MGHISDIRWREIVKSKYSEIHNSFDTKEIIYSWNNSKYKIDYEVIKLYKKYYP